MSFYIYRFLDEDNKIIYVGRTNNFQARMRQHFSSSGHLPTECYDRVRRIDHLCLSTKTDMKIKELYYISKYRPEYNTMDMEECTLQIDETQDAWAVFQTTSQKISYISEEDQAKYEEKISYLSDMVEKLEKDNSKLERTITSKEIALESLRKILEEDAESSREEFTHPEALDQVKQDKNKMFAVYSNKKELRCLMYWDDAHDDFVSKCYSIENPSDITVYGLVKGSYPVLEGTRKTFDDLFYMSSSDRWVDITDRA